MHRGDSPDYKFRRTEPDKYFIDPVQLPLDHRFRALDQFLFISASRFPDVRLEETRKRVERVPRRRRDLSQKYILRFFIQTRSNLFQFGPPSPRFYCLDRVQNSRSLDLHHRWHSVSILSSLYLTTNGTAQRPARIPMRLSVQRRAFRLPILPFFLARLEPVSLIRTIESFDYVSNKF